MTPAGAPPRSGWALMVAEVHVTNLAESLDFWCGALGFGIAFERQAECFAYLEHAGGQQVMLCQRNGRFETGPLERPFGRGVMFQLYLPDIAPVLRALAARDWPLYAAAREVWRSTGDRESGQREAFVQDPDGYLVMVAQDIGERPLPAR